MAPHWHALDFTREHFAYALRAPRFFLTAYRLSNTAFLFGRALLARQPTSTTPHAPTHTHLLLRKTLHRAVLLVFALSARVTCLPTSSLVTGLGRTCCSTFLEVKTAFVRAYDHQRAYHIA